MFTIFDCMIKISIFREVRACALCIFFLLCCQHPAVAQSKESPSSKKKVKTVLYGQASFYADKFHGRRTANGETFSQKKMTAACNSLPLGTWVKVTNLKNGRTVIVKTNDRLHAKTRRLLDLTKTAAQKLRFVSSGLTRVKVEVLGKKRP
jgi:rare lipoprotein A